MMDLTVSTCPKNWVSPNARKKDYIAFNVPEFSPDMGVGI